MDGKQQLSSQSSSLDEEDLRELESSSKPTSTKRSTSYGVKRFTDSLQRRGRNCDFNSISAEDLNETLRKFYAEVKPLKQGKSLTPSTLTCIRAAIHRHITGAPYYRSINIIKDREFLAANNMFTAKCKLYFKTGNAKPKHKPVIGEGDLQKLGLYFENWRSNPDILVETVWYFLCFFFGRRGREGWTQMTKNTFTVETDTEGHDFVCIRQTEITKNHQGGHKQCDIDYTNQRMYGEGVIVFEFFISKLHKDLNRLFQMPLATYDADGHWYQNMPMGKNTLARMMQKISKKAGLSQEYTCHSVRASTITTLFQKGISPQSIISVTNHKNTSSLQHYISDLSSGQKRECSDILSMALKFPKHTKSPSAKSSSAVVNETTEKVVTPETPMFNIDIEPLIGVDLQELQNISTTEKENICVSESTPVVMDLELSADGSVTIPSPKSAPPGSIFNIPLQTSPAANISTSSTTNTMSNMKRQNVVQNFLSNANLNNCTINMIMKPN